MPVTAAVSLTVPIVSYVVNRLGDFLLRETSIFSDDTRHEVERMQRELEFMQNFLQDADSQRVDNTSHVWDVVLRSIRDVAYEVEDVVEDYMHSRYTPSKTMIVGFEEEIKSLVEQLKSNAVERLCVISIVGMAGIGKTALANQIYCNAEIVKEFPVRVWVTVSDNPEMSEILKKISSEIHENLTVGLLNKLKGVLNWIRERRCLIVLDDVWDKDVWDAIKRAIPDQRNGSRVILTTRSIYVARSADPDTLHKIRFLNETESKELFLRTVFPNRNNEEFEEELQDVGQELVKRCHGLPLALVTLGSYLSIIDKNVHQWSRALRTLDWHATEVRECMDTLGMSYKLLPYHLKPCFLYFASFPSGSRISAKRLIRLWIAEGFIPQKEIETSEETAESFLDELIRRCMVQVAESSYDRSVKEIYVHELLHELCIKEARVDKFLHNLSISSNMGHVPSSPDVAETRRLAIHQCITDDYKDPHTGKWLTPKLRTLLGFNLEADSKIAKSFEGLNLMRVIDLQGVHGLQTLNDEVTNMFFLRYLRLRGADSLFLMLDLRGLRNLQTLDANSGKPAMSLCYTGILKHLQVLRCMKAGKWIAELPRLSSLKKLGIRDVTIQYENDLINSLAQLNQLVSLTLQSKEGVKGSIPTEVLTLFQNEHPLESLKLRGPLSRRDHLPRSSEFPPGLTKLILKKSELKQDPMEILEKLPKLMYLELRNNAYIGNKMTCTTNGFPKLECMILDDLPNLSSWKVENGAMSHLTHLAVDHCPALRLPKRLKHGINLHNCRCYVCQSRIGFTMVQR